ncbi:hypothetical protein KC360_g93 [Hortaea werneckii]|nr:hypothetical protein KC344_g91 [Hortaea werneckii]KAI7180531.1 hypothetical protein KC360_g93 [Hortaea werneckii]
MPVAYLVPYPPYPRYHLRYGELVPSRALFSDRLHDREIALQRIEGLDCTIVITSILSPGVHPSLHRTTTQVRYAGFGRKHVTQCRVTTSRLPTPPPRRLDSVPEILSQRRVYYAILS